MSQFFNVVQSITKRIKREKRRITRKQQEYLRNKGSTLGYFPMKCLSSAKPSQKSPRVERSGEQLDFKWKIRFASVPISHVFCC